MALLQIDNCVIKGISACVPANIVDNLSFSTSISNADKEKIIEKTGIKERRFVNESQSSTDLAYCAAENLINSLKIDRNSIDILLFVSQTPDYQIPTSSAILQNRLRLPNSTAAFDINQGCSGYVYGLSTAFSYASQKGINRVLLLVAETLSKTLSPNDRNTSLLFGDGASATLIEKSETENPAWFSLNTDGAGENAIKINSGGFRNPVNESSFAFETDSEGNSTKKTNLRMDGIEVFNFTVREVPSDIKKLLGFAEKTIDSVDWMVFHQSNKYMIDFFLKRLKFPSEKSPVSIQKFGNTSGVSIPLTIVSELKNKIQPKNAKTVLCGYGSGLSWASCLLDLSNCYICELSEL
ncbi:MAG: ketoacyl-ACP synthase III [Bacteroidales bacterium]|nr:ketoacyl-ACP synthase III [Bacteroidales bacterium]